MSDLIEYAKRHLLAHMSDAGMTDEELEAKIAAIPPYHPLRAHFVSQFVANLPQGEREAATMRLLPPVNGNQIKITVLTVPEQPSFRVSANANARWIDQVVQDAYGAQDNGAPHNWRGDIAED